jgi:hypothetical protein
MAKIVECVKCEVCGELHELGDEKYIELSGRLRIDQRHRGRDLGGTDKEYVKFLGKEDNPTVLCRGTNANESQKCLLTFMNLMDNGY